MPDNGYNYSSPNLAAGSGVAEELMRNGFIANPEGVHTPRTEGDATETTEAEQPQVAETQSGQSAETATESKVTSSSSETSNTGMDNYELIDDNNPETNPDVPVPKANKVVKDEVVLYEQTTLTGRTFLRYDGHWGVEFDEGNEEEARQFMRAHSSNIYRHLNVKGKTVYLLNETQSQVEYTQADVDIVRLREEYDNNAVDITPYFEEAEVKTLSAQNVEYFLLNTLEDKANEKEFLANAQFFTKDVYNLPYTYFGHESDEDVGFYLDYAGNIRATYDHQYIGRAKPLIKDLLFFGKPEDYAIARLPTGTIQFVIREPLVSTLLKERNGHNNLAFTYNAKKEKEVEFTEDELKVFERVLDLSSNTLMSITNVFGKPLVKKSTENT